MPDFKKLPTVNGTAVALADHAHTAPLLTGLQLWLDASQLVGLADGDLVASWPDSSGNGRAAVQATGTAKPTYKTGVMNGRAVLRFDGTSDKLETSSYSLAQPYTIVGVVSTTDTAGPRDFHGSLAGNANVIAYNGNWNLYGGGLLVGPAASTRPTIVTATFDSGTSSVRANGPGSEVVGNAGTGTISGGSIIGTAGAEWWSGDIAEVLIYKPVPSDAELLLIEQYLDSKWGITATGAFPLTRFASYVRWGTD